MIRQNTGQGQLAFVHQTAETSKAAHRNGRQKQNSRKLAIENHCLLAGRDGLTRDEIAQKTKLIPASVCPLVRSMIDAGTLVEPGTRRQTQSGQSAKVVVLACFTGEISQ